LEKSLGAVAKGGTSPLIDVYDYAERVTSPGFTFMNTPGYDPVSLTGLAAGGCNLIAFTTGRGSAIGFPSIPVIKIASNSNTYRRMTDNMDINAGAIADGDKTVQQVGRWIVRRLAPHCARIDLSDLLRERDEERLLFAMGFETANVHLGTAGVGARIAADLRTGPRDARWLNELAKIFADAIERDFRRWRAG